MGQNLNLSGFQHFYSQFGRIFFKNKDCSALKTAGKMKKRPPISPLEGSASFQFFSGNNKESCFFHVFRT